MNDLVAAFRSEWLKLRRPTLLFGTFVGLAVAASLFSALVFSQAQHAGGRGDLPSLEQLAQPNGLIHGLSRAVVLLGIVAFGIAATQIASEYTYGTLRQLLVRQPRRQVVLVGKYLAVVTFLVAAVAFAAIVSGLVSELMAHTRGVDTTAWTSATGLDDLGSALGELLLAVVGFATLGMIVGLFLRSSVAAVIVGFAYLLPAEGIIGVVLHGSEPWLPGQLLVAVAQGGTTSVTFGVAALRSLVYLAVGAAAAMVWFAKRDVTA
jgi:ABC-type transport system involved in multi-copper enzyme maturation permease subunit